MQDFDFAHYCASFLKDKSLGDSIFYKTQDHEVEKKIPYRQLIAESLTLAETLKNSPFDSLILQIESPYILFIHLLAGIFCKKKILIISSNDSEKKVETYKTQLGFFGLLHGKEKYEEVKMKELPTSINQNSPAFYILSSGSSGPSKAIALSLNNVYSSASDLIDFFQIKPFETTFLNLPHYHIGGLMILWRAFFSGSSVTTSSESAYQFISLVPLQLKRFLESPENKLKLQTCRGVLIGGAQLDDSLKALAEIEHIPVFETYGMSETSSLVLLNGVPLKSQEVKLNQEGRFLIKGPTLSSSVKIDEEGFFLTNDLGRKNADGSFSFEKRMDLLFKSAGVMIDPLEIEKKAKELPWLDDVVVVPIAHPTWGFASTLIYKASDNSKSAEEIAEDIKAFLKKELHPHHVPKYFFPMKEANLSDKEKPKRFFLSQWAQEIYFKQKFNYQFTPTFDAKKLTVFFHGFMEDLHDLTAFTDENLNTNFLFIDLAGHGKTMQAAFESRSDFFTQLSALITFYKKDFDLILYGYSMGGRVALELTLSGLSPELLILESAHFGMISSEEKLTRLHSDRKLFENEGDLGNFFKKWYQNPIFSDYIHSKNYSLEIDRKIKHPADEWRRSLEFFSPGHFPYLRREVLEKMSTQKIVGITGEHDHKYRDHYRELSGKLPEFTHYEIKEAGHNPHKTHKEEIVRILKELI